MLLCKYNLGIMQKVVVKKKIGRPVKYETREQLIAVLQDYFEKNYTEDNPPSISELAYFLGLSRQGFLEYSNKEKFSDIIRDARLLVEAFGEKQLISKKTSAVGVIFSLKQLGWRDDKQITVKHENIATLTQKIQQGEVVDGELVGDVPALDGDDDDDEQIGLE